MSKQFVPESGPTVGSVIAIFTAVETLAVLAGKLHERKRFEALWEDVKRNLCELTGREPQGCDGDLPELLLAFQKEMTKYSGGVLPPLNEEALCGLLHFYGGYTLQMLYRCSLREYGILWKGMISYGK